MKIIYSLILYYLRAGQGRNFLSGQPVLFQPLGRCRLLKYRICVLRIVAAGIEMIVLQIIYIILSRHCLRLKNNLTLLLIHLETAYIHNPSAGRRIHYYQILLFRAGISPAACKLQFQNFCSPNRTRTCI